MQVDDSLPAIYPDPVRDHAGNLLYENQSVIDVNEWSENGSNDGEEGYSTDDSDDKSQNKEDDKSKIPVSMIYTIDDEVMKLVRRPDMLVNPNDWASWSESFLKYLEVARVSDHNKVKILLTYLHPRILRDKVADIKFTDAELNDINLAVIKLGRYIAAPASTMSSRLKLVKLNQGVKTLSQFVDAIRALSRDCDFGDSKVMNTTMISSLIGGLTNNDIKFELLKQREGYNTFDEAVADAVRFDLARSTMAEVDQGNDLLYEIRNTVMKSQADAAQIMMNQDKELQLLRTQVENMEKQRGYNGFEHAVQDAIMLDLAKSTTKEKSDADSELLCNIRDVISGSDIKTTTDELRERYDNKSGSHKYRGNSWRQDTTIELISDIRSSVERTRKKQKEAIERGDIAIMEARDLIQEMKDFTDSEDDDEYDE